MFWGFYRELEEMRADGMPDASFGFLENVPVGESYNLYDFLHGWCDYFAAALSDYFGYELEYVVGNDDNLIHAYCVQTLVSGEIAYIDARGITTDIEAFFDEFADFCTYYRGELSDTMGDCDIFRSKNSREMLGDKNRELNQDKDLYQFLKENRSYFDVNTFEREKVNMEKNNTGLNAFENSILARLENKGIDASKMKLDVVQFIDEKHRCCLWYGGQVAEVKYRGFSFSLEARGDVVASLVDEDGRELGYVKDRNNIGEFFGQMKRFFANDREMLDASDSGRLELEDNNWFEIFVQIPDGEWSGESIVCDHDDIKEALVQMVEDMDYLIDEFGKGLDPEGEDRELLARLALEHFGYDGELALQDEYYLRHLDTFIDGYQDDVDDIDMDFWAQYEELLGERISYEEYVFVDCLYEGDPLELMDEELTEAEVALFAQIKDALVDYRTGKVNEVAVGLLVEAYKEYWTPDKNDAIYEKIARVAGEAYAEAACKGLEDEYSSWFDKVDSVEGIIEEAQEKAVSFNEAKKLEEHTYGNHIFMRLEVDGEVHEVSNYAGTDGKWDTFKTTADGTEKRDRVIEAFNELY